MSDKHPNQRGSDRPEFDPRRSAEIRSLLVRTVVGTPTPRHARLSRPAFALAASVALLVAGGIGAGSVVAYDRLSGSVIAQDSAGPAAESTDTGLTGQSSGGFEPLSDGAPGPTGAESSGDATSGFSSTTADALTPVLTLNGELGYAYPSDLNAAGLALRGVTADSDIVVEPTSAFGGVPIYSADGAIVLGYFDPAGLAP